MALKSRNLLDMDSCSLEPCVGQNAMNRDATMGYGSWESDNIMGGDLEFVEGRR